jgi:alkylresorcinol/alkylpyrone synthase
LREWWKDEPAIVERFGSLQRAVRVEGRYFSRAVDAYTGREPFADRNEEWTRIALDLGETAVRDALGRAGLAPVDIDHLFFVTVTGIATPSIEARLANRLGLAPSMKRTPIFGLGCVAGAAGTARAADYLRAFPYDVSVLLSVELCSLTFQRDDRSVANLISTNLFGDGAAAVVLVGGEREAAAGPRVLASRSIFYRDTEEVMGWALNEFGLKIQLTGDVAKLVSEHLRGDVDAFLAEHGLTRGDVKHWISHTGGPKVLEAIERTLELPRGALGRTWSSLGHYGNLSSSSVLFVLCDLLESKQASPGDYGVMMAMGPGFCSELVLLQF